MRSFTEILLESEKVYEFKVGIAGELPTNFKEHMKTALEKYGIVSISNGKRTPIQERPLDFPQLQNMEVNYFEVSLKYPTTQQVLQEYLGQSCSVDQSYIIVRNKNEAQEEYQAEKDEKPYESLLSTHDMGGESAQLNVGENRVMELLKELEKARKEQDNDPTASAPKGESKDIDSKINAKSVIGN